MIRTLVIDDEPLALQQLAAYTAKIPLLEQQAKGMVSLLCRRRAAAKQEARRR